MLLLSGSISRLFSNQITSSISIQVRTKVIYHMPQPTEVRRVRKQGYLKRAQTPTGRRYMMERILRGDKVVAQ